jgi:hypothetical protein
VFVPTLTKAPPVKPVFWRTGRCSPFWHWAPPTASGNRQAAFPHVEEQSAPEAIGAPDHGQKLPPTTFVTQRQREDTERRKPASGGRR